MATMKQNKAFKDFTVILHLQLHVYILLHASAKHQASQAKKNVCVQQHSANALRFNTLVGKLHYCQLQ